MERRPKREAAHIAGICDICYKTPTQQGRKACRPCLGHANDRSKARQARLRIEVICAYGGRCTCPSCPETNNKFLTLDHVDNDGNQHRSTSGASHIWRWAKNNGFPKTLRLMCANCNLGRSWNGGKCPHQEI